MKIQFFFLFFIGPLSSITAQITFDKGYIIDTSGQRIRCLIRYAEWRNNPSEFVYKLSGKGSEQKGTITNAIEFGIDGICKYISSEVQIDRSSDDITQLSEVKDPVWYREKIFLKVLVEGKASLFYYEDGSIQRYFFSLEGSKIHQLIYKRYLQDVPDHGSVIALNNSFRQQLMNELKCSDSDYGVLESLQYYRKDLTSYFNNYNGCKGATAVNYSPKKGGHEINFRIRTGISFTSLSITNSAWPHYLLDYGNKILPVVGLEAEYLLPFNRNKWGFIFEPLFQKFKAEKKVGFNETSINYPCIEFPFGVRYYIFLGKDLKLFADAIFVPSITMDFNAKIWTDKVNYLETGQRSDYAVGLGIAYKRFNFETRYYGKNTILSNYLLWVSEYGKASMILGYRL